MRQVLGFVTAFAAVLLVAALIRATMFSQDGAPTPAASERKEPPAAPQDDKMGGIGMGDGDEKPAEKPLEKPADVQDLGNMNDPVTGENPGEPTVLLEHAGWRIKFSSDESRKKFAKNPPRYYAKLSLEPALDGKLIKVDASQYQKTTAEKCAIMGGDLDPDGDVFILHRGFKIYFCCWSGCADEFLKDPHKHYAHYGLEEKAGKLVKK